jgi:hypothetical protein
MRRRRGCGFGWSRRKSAPPLGGLSSKCVERRCSLANGRAWLAYGQPTGPGPDLPEQAQSVKSRTSTSFRPAGAAPAIHPRNRNTRNLMSASNLEMVPGERRSGSAILQKPSRTDPAQSRVGGIHDPGRDHGRSSGKRSELPAEVLLLEVNCAHRRSDREGAPLPSVHFDQVLRARSHRRLVSKPARSNKAHRGTPVHSAFPIAPRSHWVFLLLSTSPLLLAGFRTKWPWSIETAALGVICA